MKLIETILLFIGVIFVFALLFFVMKGSEDSWIKDEKGVWITHDFLSKTPDYVKEQQTAISCALNLFNQKKQEGIIFSSQCLGTCENYAVDIVHVPRNDEDDLKENQCEDYKEGKVSNFIELNKDGNIIRIV